MRLWAMAILAAVAGCAVHDGRYPGYRINDDSRYDTYRRDREVALTSGQRPPRIVPVTLPVDAPTPEQIAGTDRPRKAAVVVATRPATSAPVQARSTPALVSFVFAAQHAPGTRVWNRPARASEAAAIRACARYSLSLIHI